MHIADYTKRNLTTQGFLCVEPGFERVAPWLRLNPVICLSMAVTALAFGSAALFFVLAGFAAWGAFAKNSPGDMLYNIVIRRWLLTPPIPPSPAPRRFACFVGTMWSLATGLLLIFNYTLAAYALGLAFIAVVIPMVAAHFCIASLIYQVFKSRWAV
mgnify:CR=1 FL=1